MWADKHKAKTNVPAIEWEVEKLQIYNQMLKPI